MPTENLRLRRFRFQDVQPAVGFGIQTSVQIAMILGDGFQTTIQKLPAAFQRDTGTQVQGVGPDTGMWIREMELGRDIIPMAVQCPTTWLIHRAGGPYGTLLPAGAVTTRG